MIQNPNYKSPSECNIRNKLQINQPYKVVIFQNVPDTIFLIIYIYKCKHND